MNESLDFFTTTMPASRPADYYLGCLDSCIFMDFNNCSNGRIRLVRISFDGYGCAELGDKSIPMSEQDSHSFKEIIKAGLSDQLTLSLIVKRTLQENSNLIWHDALKEYGLD